MSNPFSGNIKEKSPYFRTSSHLKYGGEGGIDSLALALRAACSLCSQSVQLAVASCRTPVGGSHSPPAGVQYAKKKPAFSCELFFKYGGEGGIRTPDTLPYTHFPGVLLQPLGHLTILSSRCCGTGANVRKSRTNVNSLFQLIRPFSQTSNNMIPKCAESGFFINNAVC